MAFTYNYLHLHTETFFPTVSLEIKLPNKDGWDTWKIVPQARKLSEPNAAYILSLPFFDEQLKLNARFSALDLENYVMRWQLTQEFLCVIFEMDRSRFQEPILTVSASKETHLILLSGYSGLGKSHLIYEIALVLLAKPSLFRVCFLGRCGWLLCKGNHSRDEHYKKFIKLMEPVFYGFPIDWNKYLLNYEDEDSFAKLLSRIDHMCQQNNIRFILIIDDLNQLFANGTENKYILETIKFIATSRIGNDS